MKKTLNLWSLLPEEITSLIITSGLDLKSMVRCTLVCKQWRNLISTNYRPVPKGEFQFLGYDSGLHRFGAVDDETHQIAWMKTLDSPWRTRQYPPPEIEVAMSSCNGLVCFISTLHQDVYICNPIMGEYISLPKKSLNGKNYTLGFSPSSNEYKLVLGRFGSIEIYTLGDPSGWRRVPLERRGLGDAPAICISGVLHWFLDKTQSLFTFDIIEEMFGSIPQRQSILTFDIAEEVFGSIPLPRLEADKVIYQLGCLDHCLVVTAGYMPSLGMEIWVRKENEDKSSGELVWTKNWVIDVAPPLVNFAVLKPRKLSTDGCIIMTSHYYSSWIVYDLYCYDPREKRFRPYLSPIRLHAFDYTPSLVSPKKLMQTNGQQGSKIEKKEGS